MGKAPDPELDRNIGDRKMGTKSLKEVSLKRVTTWRYSFRAMSLDRT